MVSDHFQPWRHTDGHAPFSFTWLGALGERTSRAIIGTSVVTPTFRYHPSIVAQAMATLGAMYPDRVMLGVGSGESLNDVPATGMAWPTFKERFGRLREAIQLMRQPRPRGSGELSRASTTGPSAPPSTTAPRPRSPSTSPPPARPQPASPGASPTASSAPAAKSPELYTDTLLPAVAEGLEKAGRAAGQPSSA